jgi:hypothetical protein
MPDLLTRPKPRAVRSHCRRVTRAAHDRAGCDGFRCALPILLGLKWVLKWRENYMAKIVRIAKNDEKNLPISQGLDELGDSFLFNLYFS